MTDEPDLITRFFNEKIRKDIPGVCSALTKKMRRSPTHSKLVVYFLHNLRHGRRDLSMTELRGLVESPSNLYSRLSFYVTYKLVTIHRAPNPSQSSVVYLTDDFLKIKDELEAHVNKLLGEGHE